MSVLLGLDLSLSASAAVSVPLDWGGDWSRVRSQVFASSASWPDSMQIMRLEPIANGIESFADECGATEAWIEGYAFSRRSTSAHVLAELGGLVRWTLAREGIRYNVATASTARKLLLGACPRGGDKAKAAVKEALLAAGCPPYWTLDETDAFCIVNHGLAERGGFFFAS